ADGRPVRPGPHDHPGDPRIELGPDDGDRGPLAAPGSGGGARRPRRRRGPVHALLPPRVDVPGVRRPVSSERADQRAPVANGLGDAVALTDEPSVLGAAAPLQAEVRRSRRPAARTRRGAGRSRSTGRPAAVDGADESGIVHVFEADSRDTRPLVPYLRDLWDRRRFMVELARAELRGRRSSTALGALWSILDPLFQAAIFYLLFTIIRGGQRPIGFLHILIGGIFLFQLALSAITEGGRSIRSSKNLMLNSTFPRAMFPITTICRNVMRFGPSVVVYAAFHLGLGAPV